MSASEMFGFGNAITPKNDRQKGGITWKSYACVISHIDASSGAWADRYGRNDVISSSIRIHVLWCDGKGIHLQSIQSLRLLCLAFFQLPLRHEPMPLQHDASLEAFVAVGTRLSFNKVVKTVSDYVRTLPGLTKLFFNIVAHLLSISWIRQTNLKTKPLTAVFLLATFCLAGPENVSPWHVFLWIKLTTSVGL